MLQLRQHENPPRETSDAVVVGLRYGLRTCLFRLECCFPYRASSFQSHLRPACKQPAHIAAPVPPLIQVCGK